MMHVIGQHCLLFSVDAYGRLVLDSCSSVSMHTIGQLYLSFVDGAYDRPEIRLPFSVDAYNRLVLHAPSVSRHMIDQLRQPCSFDAFAKLALC